ncbi:MAG: protein phosphatase CheZ [Rhodospirillaceae bacterium]
MTEVARFNDDDYEELKRFVSQTPRGRAFLREHERRSQKLAAEEVIRLINDLRDSWRQHSSGIDSATKVEVLRRELLDMSASINQARREIASLRPKDETEGSDRIMTATNELDAIVQSTERASFDILNAAERMMDRTAKLRAANAPENLCADIDNEVSNIFTACSFQDLTGQRTTKVVNALRYIEQRVMAMMSIWGNENDVTPTCDNGPVDKRPDAHLLNGPSDNGVSQDEIDRMLGSFFTSKVETPVTAPEATMAPAPAPPVIPSTPPVIPAAPAPAPPVIPATPPVIPAAAASKRNIPNVSQSDIDDMFP